MTGIFAPDAPVNLSDPIGSGEGGDWYVEAIDELRAAIPDLERRETIRMSGHDGRGQLWVGVCGYFCGQWDAPWRGIRATRRMAHLRFHEFLRVEGGRVVELQALWDVPELFLQAGVWPLVPSLGREWHVPGPAAQDGLTVSGDGSKAMQIVTDMLVALKRNREGVEAMELDRYWHPRCSWYGPSGIGTARGIQGFRDHHQAPFLAAMPDRRAFLENGHFFAEGDFVGFTAWPGMEATLSSAGWLGLPGTGQVLTMRSLDFWRVEGEKIVENWVLVDLIHVYRQLGIDVFARMRELL